MDRDVELEAKQPLEEVSADTTSSENAPGRLKHEINSILTFLFFTATTGGIYFALRSSQLFSDEQDRSVGSLLILLISAITLGRISTLASMPPLLGMLLAGLLWQNLAPDGFLSFPSAVGTLLRKFAFLIILLRAGLGLDGEALKRLKGACLRLALIPCTAEALAVAFAAWLLFDLAPVFGLLLGFVLAAVSPAVVVPGMLDLQERKLGVSQGIPTLVTAAASIDDVYAITLFSLALSFVKSTGKFAFDCENCIEMFAQRVTSALDVVIQIVRAPLEVLAGGIAGVGIGCLLWVVPSSFSEDLGFRRMTLLLTASSCVFFGSITLDIETAGPFAVLVAGFVAAIKWRKQKDDDSSEEMTEERYLKIIWDYFAQPFLFSLIGFQLVIAQIDGSSVAFGVLVLLCGLAIRMLASYCAVLGTSLSTKERGFVAIAWLPKATVQARVVQT